ncbi:MAG: hypothetical protein LBB72_04765 [Spirochaetaceae bacterium]|jgi:hypothetical protein|nr:hypothetical protein [Spirochaetaceae bacterium]
MKNMRQIFGIIAVSALLGFAGCEKDLDSSVTPIINDGAHTVTITGIPSQHRSMEIRIMSDIDPYPGVEVACGYNEINKGKTAIPLLDQYMEDWIGSGEYFIVLDLDKVYVYTDGSPVPPMDNIKKYNFQNSGTEIDFSKFSTYDEDSSNPYRITITDITENYNAFTGTVNVYNAASGVIADGKAAISDSTAKIDLYVDDLFHSGWKGGVEAAFTFTISGTNYVYTGSSSLDNSIGEGTWGNAPKYNFRNTSSSVSFSRFKTNDIIYLPTVITINGLDSKYSTDDHFASILVSASQGYNPLNSIMNSGDINSGNTETTVSLPQNAGPLFIFLIVIKTEKVMFDGIEFPKEVPVAAYQTKTAINITTGLTLNIGSNFEEADIPDIDDGNS